MPRGPARGGDQCAVSAAARLPTCDSPYFDVVVSEASSQKPDRAFLPGVPRGLSGVPGVVCGDHPAMTYAARGGPSVAAHLAHRGPSLASRPAGAQWQIGALIELVAMVSRKHNPTTSYETAGKGAQVGALMRKAVCFLSCRNRPGPRAAQRESPIRDSVRHQPTAAPVTKSCAL